MLQILAESSMFEHLGTPTIGHSSMSAHFRTQNTCIVGHPGT